MSEHGKRTRGGLLPLAAAVRAGDGFRKSMDTVIAQASAAPEAVLRLGGAPQASPEREALEAAFLSAVEAHKSHRPNLRHDPDGIWRCPECDPTPPGSWIRLITHAPHKPLARGYWFAARAVAAWWEQVVDAARERRRR